MQMLFIAWIMGEQNQLRPMFPRDMTKAELIRASTMFNLVPRLPAVDWSEALSHLPVQDILRAVDGPNGIFADRMPVDTGGAMIQREPNDPAWYKGGLYHDNMPLDVPGLYFMSWYDVSVGPNLALYNHARKTSKVPDQHWAIIAPVAHCAFSRASADTVVAERSMGDARLNYQEIIDGFFDRFVKGVASPVGSRAGAQSGGPGVGDALRPVHGADVRRRRVHRGVRSRGGAGGAGRRLRLQLAWGLADAVMYLIRTVTTRGKSLTLVRSVRAASPEAGRRLIERSLSRFAAGLLSAAEIEAMRGRILALAFVPERPTLKRDELVAAFAVFLIVVASTLPVALPFLMFDDVRTAVAAGRFVKS